MTDLEMRIAIAKSIGVSDEMINRWLDYELAERQFQHAEISVDEYYQRHLRVEPNCVPRIPDYLSDLNAMHEAEPTAPRFAYYKALCLVVCGAPATGLDDWAQIVSATARQRAEAFLRTIGKWTDK